MEIQLSKELMEISNHNNIAKDRRKEIIQQVTNDIRKIDISSITTDFDIHLAPEKLKKEILECSEKERQLWTEKENGLYTTLVNFSSKSITRSIQLLPEFSSQAALAILRNQKTFSKKFKEILKEIHNIEIAVRSTDTNSQEFEDAYREYIIRRYGKVELPGANLGNRKLQKYDIFSSYIELYCTDDEMGYEEVSLTELFASTQVLWIKGEAGSGKTTFLQWVAVSSAKNSCTDFTKVHNPIPIVIELRNSSFPLSVDEPINRISQQIGLTCPARWRKSLFTSGKAIVLIDGLDEIPKAKREKVFNFIEELSGMSYRIKILVTSRNSVKEDLVCDYRSSEIRPMKMDSIREFILNWHRSVLFQGHFESIGKIKTIQKNLLTKIAGNQPLKLLARNPLLCAMICALNYSNNEYLPSDKMDLYEKCCEMLIESRDVQREICSTSENIIRQSRTINKPKATE